MTVGYDALKPYKSLILAQVSESHVPEVIVEPVILDFKSLLNIDGNPDLDIVTEGPTKFFEVTPQGSSEKGQMLVKFLHYAEKRAPSWYRGKGEVQDTLNHLIVACQLKRQVVIHVSDSRKREAVIRQIRLGGGDSLGALKLLPAELLNAAFVRGPTRTVWLSGIHAPVSVKADSKVLSGPDLRDALDPLGDQSYCFTAARSSVPNLRLFVGVSPRDARIWANATCDWDNFVNTVADLLYYVEATTGRATEPLPALAVPVSEAPALAEAFEICFLPPELLADDPSLGPETKEKMERWACQTNLEIQETHNDSLEVGVTMDGVSLGRLKLVFDTSDTANVKIAATVKPPDPACPDEYAAYFEELKKVSKNARWIKVRYESGHTLTDCAIFKVQYRDQSFDNFLWSDFKGYKITKEKFWEGPMPANASDLIGTQKSLFCWVRKNWPPPSGPYSGTTGWLACVDGPMEIADFIHLDVGGEEPVLTQIHVKGSGSDATTRGIRVTDYELVTGQAVKNVRFLDRLNMVVGLRERLGTKIGKLVWYNGLVSTREEMLEAIAEIKTSYLRVVVILQPSVRKKKLEEVHKAISEDKYHPDTGRVHQLDTLLLDAQDTCRKFGAKLWVLAHEA
jgi:hypothetical protein